MSNLEPAPAEAVCGGLTAVATEPVRELLPGSAVALGGPRGFPVTRTLPNRERRMVGAWCFLDAGWHCRTGSATSSPASSTTRGCPC